MNEARLLPYAGPESRARRGRMSLRDWIALAIWPLFLALIGVICFVPVREDNLWMDAVTGSRRRQTIWLHHFSLGARVEPSPLELRIKRMGLACMPRWQFVAGPECTLLGGAVVNVCGRLPPIYLVGMLGQDYAQSASDAEVIKLVQTMQTGSDAQQTAFAQEIFDKKASSQ